MTSTHPRFAMHANVRSYHGHPRSFDHFIAETDPTKFSTRCSSCLSSSRSLSPPSVATTPFRISRFTHASDARSPREIFGSTCASKTSRASATISHKKLEFPRFSDGVDYMRRRGVARARCVGLASWCGVSGSGARCQEHGCQEEYEYTYSTLHYIHIWCRDTRLCARQARFWHPCHAGFWCQQQSRYLLMRTPFGHSRARVTHAENDFFKTFRSRRKNRR